MRRLFLLLLPLLACHPAANGVPVPPGPLTIELERDPCFGFCPTYRLTLDRSGRGAFEGTGRLSEKRDSIRLADTVVTGLAERAFAEGFFGLDSAYVPGHPACGSTWTDMPSLRIRVRRGAQEHGVRLYQGCRGGDEATRRRVEWLERFGAAIDSAAGTAGWLVKAGHRSTF